MHSPHSSPPRVATKASGLIPALLLLGAFVACRGATGPSCDVCTASAIVVGHVTRADGTPVANALVVSQYYSSSTASARSTIVGPATTDGSGAFRTQIRLPTDAPSVVTLTATPEAGSGLAAVTDTLPAVRFKAFAPFDSVRVDLRVR